MRNIYKLTALTTALLATTALAAPTQAASLQVTSTQTDFVEELPFNFNVSGIADESHDYLKVFSQSKTDEGCVNDPDSTSFNNLIDFEYTSNNVGVNFDYPYNLKFDTPGTYLICAYLRDIGNLEGQLISSLNINVRENQASIGVSTDRIIKRNRKITAQLTGTTEVPRNFYVVLKRNSKRGCGKFFDQDYSSNSIDSWGEPLSLEPSTIDGDLTQEITFNGVSQPGKYLICSWVQESWDDATAEATGQTAFRVKKRKRH